MQDATGSTWAELAGCKACRASGFDDKGIIYDN
jgi:hypothetical protein